MSRPVETLGGNPLVAKERDLAVPRGHADAAAVVAIARVIEESHANAVGRNPRVRNAALRFVDNFAERELDAIATFNPADDGKLGRAGDPVGFPHGLQKRPRVLSQKFDLGQLPVGEPCFVLLIDREGHLALLGDGQQTGIGQTQVGRLPVLIDSRRSRAPPGPDVPTTTSRADRRAR